MALVGRHGELAEIERLLRRVEEGAGGVLAFTGPHGSGRTALADAAAASARTRGLEVLRASPTGGAPTRLVWVQLLRDAGALEPLVAAVRDGASTLDADAVARALVTARRVILVDDADRGGSCAAEVMAALAGRAGGGGTAVIVTGPAPEG